MCSLCGDKIEFFCHFGLKHRFLDDVSDFERFYFEGMYFGPIWGLLMGSNKLCTSASSTNLDLHRFSAIGGDFMRFRSETM